MKRLVDVWPGVCKDVFEQALFRVASAVAFFSALRIGELVAGGKGDKSKLGLQVLDVEGDRDGYLFCHQDGVPLTRYQFWKIKSAALARVGVPGARFGTHSFQIGATSTAASLGYDPARIQSIGRWRSQCYKVYVRPLPTLQRMHILIIGHSFIYWTARFATRSAWGSQLSLGAFAIVEWRDRHGLRWADVLPMALQLAEGRAPDILLTHAGGNDLGKQMGISLIMEITRDLTTWKTQYPGSKVIWSTVVPRRCDAAGAEVPINRDRRCLNREASHHVLRTGGSVAGHTAINTKMVELYRSDGVHLSDAGLTLFLDNLRRGLQAE
ncbi:hypothetical protein JRQ81_005805, partial [Phrynocephalus forsythii]